MVSYLVDKFMETKDKNSILKTKRNGVSAMGEVKQITTTYRFNTHIKILADIVIMN
jgi:hypothetical protein